MKPGFFLVSAFAAITIGIPATAKESFVARIPNGVNVPGIKALGHADTKGDSSSRNAFGKAFDSAGRKWTVALCQADTDNDGATNGQELGDPCCEWTEGATPRYSEGLSHPSDGTKTADKLLWANISCPSTTPSPSTASTTTAALAALGAVGAALVLFST